MSAARQTILAAVAKATTRRTAAEIAASAAALVALPAPLRPSFSNDQPLVEWFERKVTSERITETVQHLDDLQDLPAAVSGYLAAKGLPAVIALQLRTDLTGLDWSGIASHSAPTQDEPVAISLADWGVAETGPVVFLSAPDAPVLMNFLPLHRLVVLRTKTLLPYLEDLFDRIGQGPGDQPRSINIVIGTSGTADIEGRNVRGAHGPRFLHIFLLAMP